VFSAKLLRSQKRQTCLVNHYPFHNLDHLALQADKMLGGYSLLLSSLVSRLSLCTQHGLPFKEPITYSQAAARITFRLSIHQKSLVTLVTPSLDPNQKSGQHGFRFHPHF
jgi:hypothetical protein